MSNESTPFPIITYRTRISPVIPLVPFLIISSVIGWLYQELELIVSFFEESQDNPSFQVIEGLLLVVAAIIGGTLIVYAIKKRKIRLIQGIYAVGLTLSTTVLTWLHSFLLRASYFAEFLWIEIVGAIIGGMVGLGSIYSIILMRGNHHLKNALILILSIILGSTFGILLPMLTFTILLVLISIFDIYSVFKGPINQLFKEANIKFEENTSKKIQVVDIGIGDFVFYSALVTMVGKEFGILIAMGALLGIVLGMVFTQRILQKYQRFPGLPLPIFLGFSFVGISYIVLTYFVP